MSPPYLVDLSPLGSLSTSLSFPGPPARGAGWWREGQWYLLGRPAFPTQLPSRDLPVSSFPESTQS